MANAAKGFQSGIGLDFNGVAFETLRGGEQKIRQHVLVQEQERETIMLAGPTPRCEPLFAEVFFQGVEEVWFWVIILINL